MGITTEPMDVIEFNGVTSSSLGIIVDGYYVKGTPQRRVSTISIPGKNGVLVEDEGVYENYSQEYTLYWLPDRTTDISVLEWLRQDKYYRWKHSGMPDYHCFARAVLPSQITNYRNCYHELKVTFDCRPELYLDSGDVIITATGAIELNNPYQQTAKPKIAVYGNTTSPQKLVVNGKEFTLNGIDEYTVLDSEIQEAYKGTVNKNNTVSGEFPVFCGGSVSKIGISSGISKLEIQPRWWTI